VLVMGTYDSRRGANLRQTVAGNDRLFMRSSESKTARAPWPDPESHDLSKLMIIKAHDYQKRVAGRQHEPVARAVGRSIWLSRFGFPVFLQRAGLRPTLSSPAPLSGTFNPGPVTSRPESRLRFFGTLEKGGTWNSVCFRKGFLLSCSPPRNQGSARLRTQGETRL
jgi:hypothetical protein